MFFAFRYEGFFANKEGSKGYPSLLWLPEAESEGASIISLIDDFDVIIVMEKL